MRLYLTIALISAALGGACTKWFWPDIKIRTEIQEKEVTRNDIKTITRTVKRPDGTVERVRESTDKSVQQSQRSEVVQVRAQKQWNLGISAATKVTELRPIYGLQASRRILGPFFVGITANTEGQIGLLIQAEL